MLMWFSQRGLNIYEHRQPKLMLILNQYSWGIVHIPTTEIKMAVHFADTACTIPMIGQGTPRMINPCLNFPAPSPGVRN